LTNDKRETIEQILDATVKHLGALDTPTRASAREQFLQTVKSRSPEVLASLAKDVLPLYSALCPPNPSLRGAEPENTDPSLGIVDPEKTDPSSIDFLLDLRCSLVFELRPQMLDVERVEELQNRLDTWIAGNWLTGIWCREYAVDTLTHWTYNRLAREPDWCFDSVSHAVILRKSEPLTLSIRRWDAKGEPWAAYKRRVDERFLAIMHQHRAQEKKAAKDAKKQTATESRTQHHFGWLVDFQVNRRTMLSIAESSGGRNSTDHSTVREAIKSLASFLDLPLRPTKPGRPTKP
jgi:hypothetical protein